MLSILIFLLTGLLLWFEYDRRKCVGYPPGPLRLPLIGCIVQLARYKTKLPYLAFEKLSEIYGDVFFIRAGMSESIVFNSFETVSEILAHEFAKERSQTMVPLVWERMLRKNLGIIIGNGREWQTLRRFTIRTLRDFGFGKAASMDVVINEELEKFSLLLKKTNESHPEGVEGDGFFNLSIINILWRLVTGKDYELDDKNIQRLLNLSNRLVKSGNFGADISIAFPSLWYTFPDWFGKNIQMEILEGLGEFTKETIDHHRQQGTYSFSPNSYVDEFLTKIDETVGDPDSEFTEEQLGLCLLDLFQAGSDTTSNTLTFAMLYMLMYPEIQKKVQKEIEENVGNDEVILFAMREKLPFTYATLLESTRFASVLPFTPARQATQDFYFKGYFIKKGMALVANLHSIHFSEKIWGDPNNFRPDRYLKDGAIDTKITNYLMPFGHGSRKCLGSTLAENTLFIYFSTILKDFNVVKGRENDVLSDVPNLGFAQTPQPFQVKFVPRR